MGVGKYGVVRISLLFIARHALSMEDCNIKETTADISCFSVRVC